MRRMSGAGLVALLLFAGLVACGRGDESSPEPAEPTLGEPEVVTTGLAAPWSIAFYGATALVSERDSGRIVEVTDDGDIRQVAALEVNSAFDEGGLLGLAVRDDQLYAYRSIGDENRIDRFTITGAPGDLALSEPEPVLVGIPAANNHNGGRLAFGPDGMLYATTGDANDVDNSQTLDSLAGKILRMTPEGQVPLDNPFPESLVYSWGHRNPQGIAWADDGTMYATEFGQSAWDELNVIVPGGNYGWPDVEGIGEQEGFIDPVQQWTTPEAAPSGMTIREDEIFIANLRGRRIRTVPLNDTSAETSYFVREFGRLRDVVVAPDGSLWVLTNITDGRGRAEIDGDPGPDGDRILRLAGS